MKNNRKVKKSRFEIEATRANVEKFAHGLHDFIQERIIIMQNYRRASKKTSREFSARIQELQLISEIVRSVIDDDDFQV